MFFLTDKLAPPSEPAVTSDHYLFICLNSVATSTNINADWYVGSGTVHLSLNTIERFLTANTQYEILNLPDGWMEEATDEFGVSTTWFGLSPLSVDAGSPVHLKPFIFTNGIVIMCVLAKINLVIDPPWIAVLQVLIRVRFKCAPAPFQTVKSFPSLSWSLIIWYTITSPLSLPCFKENNSRLVVLSSAKLLFR